MTSPEWIIYEQSSRWVAALRTALARQPQPVIQPHLFESRRLTDVEARLAAYPTSIVLLEVTRTNLHEVLLWLPENVPRRPQTRCAALLNATDFPAGFARRELVDALVEAGACEVSPSARRLHSILNLAQQDTENVATSLVLSSEQPLLEWARNRLPWQADRRRIG